MLLINQVWTLDGSSTSVGNTPVELPIPPSYSLLTVSCSTIASTTSFQFQTAQASTGPWFVEGSTSISATASVPSQDTIRVTGPFTWMRPVLKTPSTGVITFRLVAVE